jgi:Fructose-2,6-bisphosphatase
MTTHITLVRHGTTEWMEKGITHGQLDAPLSKTGLQQVAASAELLRGRKFDAFFSSPTGRAWQTANIIAEVVGQTPQPLDLLKEQNFGVAEGTSIHYFPLRFRSLRLIIDWFFPHFKNGESLRDVHLRAARALDLMQEKYPDGNILVVSHYGLISMILREITGEQFKLFFLPPASITEIEVGINHKGRILSAAKPSEEEAAYWAKLSKTKHGG